MKSPQMPEAAADSAAIGMPTTPLMVFIHLRKTAGTTMWFIMMRQFRRGEAVRINERTIELANQNFNSIRPDRRARIKGVGGHFPFSPDLFAPRPTLCFTILRDPVERVVSEYYFNLRNPAVRYHAALTRERINLDQFVQSEQFVEVHNAQTRILAGAEPTANSVEMLDAAIANLRNRIALAGISERIEETLLLCRAILGWRRLIYRPVNVNYWRPRLEEIAPATLSAIEQANSLDRKLYRFACERFEQQIRQHRISDAEVKALHRAHRMYGAARRLIGFPREVWIEATLAWSRRRFARGQH